MGETQTFPVYLQGLLDERGWKKADLARASGIAESRLSRWMTGGAPSVDNARAVAEAFGRSLLEVLVAAGIITPEESRAKTVHLDVTKLTNRELVAEMERRLEAAAGRPSSTGSADEIAAGGDRYVTGKVKRSAKLVK
ncbi:helix-turn-helix domain-containing protein [Amycolatopsis sp. cmx-4-54]|uniref:helix-turn-helix domain-containing protein n=1 Tax=Amycolatopsis sp. cmx-4-54 TaxID=2790936 RepID=UPI00397DBFD2